MLESMVKALMGDEEEEEKTKMKATVVLMKKNVLDFNDWTASILDGVHEFLGKRVSLQLISAVNANGLGGKMGEAVYLEEWNKTTSPLVAGETAFKVTFDWDEDMGVPRAFLIKNDHHSEFYLHTLTLHHVPGHGRLHFVCNSWVYPSKYYNNDRVFFTNKTYLPSETPGPLVKYREQELASLRGDGDGDRDGLVELQEWDRVYDYAYYNDLGDPDKGVDYARPVLGGTSQYPYPRRGRTSRPPTKSDPQTESRLSLASSLDIYVPRDERFGHIKMSDFLDYVLKSVVQVLKPELETVFDRTPNEFDSFQDVMDLYVGGIKLPSASSPIKNITKNIPAELLKEILRTDGENFLQFPMPQVIKANKNAWRTDEEFCREMLAGTNPLCISLLREFPPTSKLDPSEYGDQASSITKEHIEHNLNGLSINEAIKKNKLFILDHHDSILPYLRKINTTSTKTYATRTILFLKDNGTLKPVAIELSLPHPDGYKLGAMNKVYTPAEDGIAGSFWQLAKAYVAVNDTGYHQLISHWLHTHAVIEPFVIATNRQLSVLHPIHKLLLPHFRDTMNINAIARQFLIDADGLVEAVFFPAKYSMEMTSFLYRSWTFPEQALPTDLVKRGMAIEDSKSPHGLRLLIEDYPYAVDGLEIWSAIETWVRDYCSFYYKNDNDVKNDRELQTWWKELIEEGHGDKKDEPWWPKMQTLKELVESCTIIIWVASALHAAVNFGQYPYGGYMPCRPTLSRRLMPEPGSPEHEEVGADPDKALLRTITGQLGTLLGVALVEILSRHSSDEVYLGRRESGEWSGDGEALEVFERFGKKLREIEQRIGERNKDGKWKNRVGAVDMPYTLLYPSSEGGLTGMGIPNSISI